MAQLVCARLWEFRNEKTVAGFTITVWFVSQREVVGFLAPPSYPNPRPTPNSGGQVEGPLSMLCPQQATPSGSQPPEGARCWRKSDGSSSPGHRPGSSLLGCCPAGPPQPGTLPSQLWSRNYAWNVKFQLVHQWARHSIQLLIYSVFKKICQVDEWMNEHFKKIAHGRTPSSTAIPALRVFI